MTFFYEPPLHVKKSLVATNIHNCKPYNQRCKNYQKAKIAYRSDSFSFLTKRPQISDFNSEISGLLSSAFLFKAEPFDNKFKSFFFSAILASSRNSLSIESQKSMCFLLKLNFFDVSIEKTQLSSSFIFIRLFSLSSWVLLVSGSRQYHRM